MTFDFQYPDENGYLMTDKEWLGDWAEQPAYSEEDLSQSSSMKVLFDPQQLDKDIWNHEPGYPVISCDIWDVHVKQALCDSGSDVSIMSLELFNSIDYPTMTQADIQLQLANSTLCQPKGMVCHLPIKIQDVYVVVDFMVVQTYGRDDIPLIIWRPFLRTTRAHIDTKEETVQLTFDGKVMKFNFQPRLEECHYFLSKTSLMKHRKKKASKQQKKATKQVWEVKKSEQQNSGFPST